MRCRGGAKAVQSRCRDAEAVQRFITGDDAGEGAEVLQRWFSPRGGAEVVVQMQCRGGAEVVQVDGEQVRGAEVLRRR